MKKLLLLLTIIGGAGLYWYPRTPSTDLASVTNNLTEEEQLQIEIFFDIQRSIIDKSKPDIEPEFIHIPTLHKALIKFYGKSDYATLVMGYSQSLEGEGLKLMTKISKEFHRENWSFVKGLLRTPSTIRTGKDDESEVMGMLGIRN